MKWWITDYDGTISHNHEGIWDIEDHDFIKEWKKDNQFIVASGRVAPELVEIFTKYEVEPSYYICNNGAYVYNSNGDLLSEINISLSVREKLYKNIEKYKDRFSIGYCLGEKRRWLSQGYKQDHWVRDEIEPNAKEEILNSPKVNIIYLIIDKKDYKLAKSVIKDIPSLKVVATSQNCIEIFDERVSKAYGIELVQKIENFDWNDCITTGDGENDLEMLQAAKHSFAIDLAPPVVVASAKKKIKRVREFKDHIDWV